MKKTGAMTKTLIAPPQKLTLMNSELLARTVSENAHRGDNYNYLDIRVSDPSLSALVISGCFNRLPEKEADTAFRFSVFDHPALFTDGFGMLTLHSVTLPSLDISCKARKIAITGGTKVEKRIYFNMCTADEVVVTDVSASELEFGTFTASRLFIKRVKISGDLTFRGLLPNCKLYWDSETVKVGGVISFL